MNLTGIEQSILFLVALAIVVCVTLLALGYKLYESRGRNGFEGAFIIFCTLLLTPAVSILVLIYGYFALKPGSKVK